MKEIVKFLINNSWEVVRILREVGVIVEKIVEKRGR